MLVKIVYSCISTCQITQIYIECKSNNESKIDQKYTQSLKLTSKHYRNIYQYINTKIVTIVNYTVVEGTKHHETVFYIHLTFKNV